MPSKSSKSKSGKTSYSKPNAAQSSTKPANLFEPLVVHTQAEEKKELQESQAETHAGFDAIWKLLKSKRRECRALQYIFWAAVLIEKDGQPIDEGGLTQLVEAILVDPTLGDHHLKKLPLQYHAKMVLCVNKIFALPEVNNNSGNYLTFLSDWYQTLNNKIKDELGDNYQITAENRDRIKEIIQADPLAQRIRRELKLEQVAETSSEDKSPAPATPPKTAQDHYFDYLVAETETEAQYSLSAAVKLGYFDNPANSKAKTMVFCDEYYLIITETFLREKRYSELLPILLNGDKQGSATAQYILKEIYDGTISNVAPKDVKKSKQYFEKALNAGFAIAQHNKAHDLLAAGQINKALELFKKAAAQNYDNSQYDLGFLYDKGNVVAKNIPQAIHWYKLAAAQDHPTAKLNLGRIYLDKKGGFYNEAEGIRLITESAEQGYEVAQNELGSIYSKKAYAGWIELNVNYDNVLQDFNKAREWFKKAADTELLKQKNGYEFNPTASNSLANINKMCNTINATRELIKYRFTTVSYRQFTYLEDLQEKNKNIILAKTEEDGWKGFQILLPPSELNLEILGLKRMEMAKLSEKDEQRLKTLVPNATFEIAIKEKAEDPDKLLITFPQELNEKYKPIIDNFQREDKSQPTPFIQATAKLALVPSSEKQRD